MLLLQKTLSATVEEREIPDRMSGGLGIEKMSGG